MNSRRCLELAARMDSLLKRELGEGVEASRLMHDALYARDVLLVCQAHRNAELQALARSWRDSLVEREPTTPAATGTRLAQRVFSDEGYGTSRFGPEQPGFFHSQAGALARAQASSFGPDSTMTPMPPTSAATKPAWYKPSRWFGGR